jgi:hypothetical protein
VQGVGAWGTGIFQDDRACDVRQEFRELVGAGTGAAEASARLRERYAGARPTDPVEDAGFWLGLAMAQWKTGRLIDDVKAEALSVIDGGADLSLWEGRQRQARARALETARAKLLSPQPPPARIARERHSSSPFQAGDIVVYTAESGGAAAAFWVTANQSYQRLTGTDTNAVLQFLAVGRPDLPPLESLLRGVPSRRRDWAGQFCRLALFDGENAVAPRWRVIGNSPWQPQRPEAIGQRVDGQTFMLAKRPGSAKLRTAWVESWLERWAAYSPLLDHQAVLRGIEEVLALDFADFGTSGWAFDSDVGARVSAYLEPVAERLRRGGRLTDPDVERWVALTAAVGLGREHPDREGGHRGAGPDNRKVPGPAWERLRDFDADFFDFARWDAASA